MVNKKKSTCRAARQELKMLEMQGECANPEMYRSRYEIRTEFGQTELDQMCSYTSQVGVGIIPVYLRRIVGSLN